MAGNLPGDGVDLFTTVEFAVAFTRAMRRQKTAAHKPSLRTSLAIPKFLSARWARLRSLAAADYVDAAVLCTPLEDQPLADAVARALLFPEAKATDEKKIAVETPEELEDTPADDPLAALMGDMADLDLDFDALTNLDDLGDLLEEDDEEDLGAFDLFETLYSSADPVDRALGELVHHFGGPVELEASGIRTRPLVVVWVARQLLAAVGELTPILVLHGVTAGYGPDLARACTEPWELAGVLAGIADPGLQSHLDDLLLTGTARELGRTLAFLGPHPAMSARREAFSQAAMSRAVDLSGFAELVVGLGEWIDPPADLCAASLAVSARRTLDAAGWLESQFGIDLRPQLFEQWYAKQARPDLGLLAVVAVACPAWEQAVTDALPLEIERLEASPLAVDAVDPRLQDTLKLSKALIETELPAGADAARKLATEALTRVPEPTQFLPVLDAFIERIAPPHDVKRTVKAAIALGVPEEEVWDRLGKALEQLRMMVLADAHDADRFQRLVQRISGMPPDMMAQLCKVACESGNLEAMAALLAVDMGAACANLPAEAAADAVNYKGIGGGRNLLTQWFTHRRNLSTAVRDRIREAAKAALMNEAFHWMGRGEGSGEKGLIPQNRSRPFAAGDSLDALDLDNTLESIVASGKTLDQVTEEDLFAKDTARGRAAMAVLIDISGSMGGGELAVCAIAVLMLLGKLLPEEIALAVFESDTHVIKNFDDLQDLDTVADQVLDLEATGGTRIEAALGWATDQFAGVPEADVRVLFLLSDFAFFEGEQVLTSHGTKLSEQGAVLLAASHGYVHQRSLDLLLDAIGGEHLKIKDMNRLPGLLLEALANIGD